MKNNLKLVCPKCGTPHQPHSPHTMDADGFERCEIRTVMEDRGWCYECSFWQNLYDKHKDDPGWVRIDGVSWVLKPMVENVPSGWNSLGCGGRKMYINIEGKGIVTSNNCWCQGDVSDAFKDLMPDNATWATKEEFDKAPVVGHIIEGIGLVFTDRGGHEVAITKHTLSTRAIPLHRSLEYPLLDQFSFVYNPPSTCWMYMPLLIISEGFTPHPYLKSSSHDFCLQDSNN